MAFSLLHALLLPDPNDRTGQTNYWSAYQALTPRRKALVMTVLYDRLYKHISTNRDLRGGAIGTILARAITQEDPRQLDSNNQNLQHYTDALRDSLRGEIIAYLDALC